MSPEIIIATVVAVAVPLIAIVFVLVRRHEQRRDDEFRRAARRLGWEDADEPSALPAGVGELRLFTLGRSRQAANALRGRLGRLDATLFDYRYTTGGGNSSRTHRQTVLAVELPGGTLPAFELRPEHVLHKISTALGYQDIDLDSRPEFSKAYLLRGADEADVRRFFQPEIVRQFERHPGWSVEGQGSWLVIYRAGKRVRPDDLREFVRHGEAIAEVMSRR